MASRNASIASRKHSRKVRKKRDEEELRENRPEPELPDGPKSYIVGGEWSQLQDINSAIALCQEGDDVRVLPGTYNERVDLNKNGLVVKGEVSPGWWGEREAEAAAARKDNRPNDCKGSCGNGEDVIIGKGVVATSTGSKLLGCVVDYGVIVERGNVAVQNCVLRNGNHNFIINGFAKPTLTRCLSLNATVASVYCYPYSRGSVQECGLHGTGKTGTVGIFCDSPGEMQFLKNKVYNQSTGASILQESKDLVLQKNSFSHIAGTGVNLAKGACCLLKGNTLDECQFYSIVMEGGASPTLDRNQINAAKVLIRKGCNPNMLKGNTISARVVDENETSNPAYAAY